MTALKLSGLCCETLGEWVCLMPWLHDGRHIGEITMTDLMERGYTVDQLTADRLALRGFGH